MEEEWRDIKGYEGKYQVSNLGRIRSLKDSHGNYREKILKPGKDKYGYFKVNLYIEGRKKPFSVHKLTAEAFIPNPNDYPQVNHKDENKINNIVDNLEWCTAKYNSNYGSRSQRLSEKLKGREFTEEHKNKISKSLKEKSTGKNNPMYGKHHTKDTKNKISKILKEGNKFKGSKNPKAHKVQCITTGRPFNCIKEAAEYYSINRVSITQCCQGKLNSAGKHPDTGEKLIWKYLEEVE